jgi:beta-N-acetylhexosaminidase
VDEAVAKILRLKLKLYPEFALEAVQVDPDAALQVCGQGTEVTQQIASQALTLLYPDANALPAAPRRGEKILLFTETRPVRECFTEQCQIFSPLSQTAVEEAILRIYGPEGTGQVDAEDITSLPFGQLKAFLAGGEGVVQDVGALLQQADWILFAQQDLNPIKGPNSDAVKLFLNHNLSTTYDGRLAVLALNAPYYLDTTEISKLSLYLAAYSKTEPFVEAAVRALFGEVTPQGASPVDVQGISYELQRRLAPDPNQTLPLVLVGPAPGAGLQPPVSVRLLAGPIVDYNGHPVPDGTQVTFYAEHSDGAYIPPRSTTTTGGLAETAFTLDNAGEVRFRAESGDARQSRVVDLTLLPPPSSTPTATAIPSRTPTATATPPPVTSSLTPVLSPTPEKGPLPPVTGPTRPVDGTDLLLAAATALLVAAGGCLLLGRKRRERAVVVQWILLAVIGGMVGYSLYALQVVRPEAWGILPNITWVAKAAVAGVVAVGALLPLGVVATAAQRRS